MVLSERASEKLSPRVKFLRYYKSFPLLGHFHTYPSHVDQTRWRSESSVWHARTTSVFDEAIGWSTLGVLQQGFHLCCGYCCCCLLSHNSWKLFFNYFLWQSVTTAWPKMKSFMNAVHYHAATDARNRQTEVNQKGISLEILGSTYSINKNSGG